MQPSLSLWHTLLFVLLGAVAFADDSGDNDCDFGKLQHCYINYLANYLIPAIPSPPAYDVFFNTISDLLRRDGWNGQLRVCGLQQELCECIGYVDHSCINTKAFEQAFNLNATDASKYQTDYYVRQYECGNGFQTLQNSFYCFAAVFEYHAHELEVCQKIEDSMVNKSEYNCTLVNEYVACVMSLFSRRCGTAIRPFICHVAEIIVKSNTNRCDMTMPRC